jgi:cytochrome P450
VTVNTHSELDAGRIRELFDLRGESYVARGGAFEGDPYPAFAELRESGPVHKGAPGELIGYDGPAFFAGLPMPDRPHFTAFDFVSCARVVQDAEMFSASEHEAGSQAYERQTMMLFLDGDRHRRLRSLVQASFMPKHMNWWVDRWVERTVSSLIDLIEINGRADLNVEFFAPIPLLTICQSFGVGVGDALDIRAAIIAEHAGFDTFNRIVGPLISARRDDPRDDLIGLLVQAELDEPDGSRHTLSNDEILIFSLLLLAAGSGTTWKQMGITMHCLLQHPEWLYRVRQDPALIGDVVNEVLRWIPTDPAFARYATRDIEFFGVEIPKGAVVHACFAAANRDPSRWNRPDEFDPSRQFQPNLGFGRGVHVCLGQHLARTEIAIAITELLDRLPNLRLDESAERPRIIGMYERGPTSVPVLWDAVEPKR